MILKSAQSPHNFEGKENKGKRKESGVRDKREADFTEWHPYIHVYVHRYTNVQINRSMHTYTDKCTGIQMNVQMYRCTKDKGTFTWEPTGLSKTPSSRNVAPWNHTLSPNPLPPQISQARLGPAQTDRLLTWEAPTHVV